MEVADRSEATFRVFSVADNEVSNDGWFEIGVAFPHADGIGYDILLRAQPLTTKLVLRPGTNAKPNEQPGRSVAVERPELSLSELVDAFERALIERCLAETGGKINRVMERLNIPRRTLSEKMARHRISRRHFAKVNDSRSNS